jgi:hypothetical protein
MPLQIGQEVPVAQEAPPTINGNSGIHVPEPNGHAQPLGNIRDALARRWAARQLLDLLKDQTSVEAIRRQLLDILKDQAPDASTPKKGAQRYSRERYNNLIADLVVQPRNPDAVLDEIGRLHPIHTLPRDLRRRVQIAGLARRAVALGASAREVLDWMARFASPMPT